MPTPGSLRLRVVLGEVVVAAARADRAELRVVVEERLVDRAGVVVEAAHDRQIDAQRAIGARRARACRRTRARSSARPSASAAGWPGLAASSRELAERSGASRRHQWSARRAAARRPMVRSRRRASPRLAARSCLPSRSTSCNTSACLSAGIAKRLEQAAQQLAVVDVDRERAERELVEDAVDHRGQLGVVRERQRVLADHVDVALVELADTGRAARARRDTRAGSGSAGTES